MLIGQFVPPSACLGLFGHSRDSFAFLDPLPSSPPESGTFGTFTYLPVRWRAIPFPNKPVRPTKSLFGPFWALSGLVRIRVTTEWSATLEWHFWDLHLPSRPMACHSLSKYLSKSQ